MSYNRREENLHNSTFVAGGRGYRKRTRKCLHQNSHVKMQNFEMPFSKNFCRGFIMQKEICRTYSTKGNFFKLFFILCINF